MYVVHGMSSFDYEHVSIYSLFPLHSLLHSFITLLLHSLLITLIGALHSHYTRTGECNRGVMVLHHITGVTPSVTLSVVLVWGLPLAGLQYFLLVG